jgi:hypothetical protein
MILKFLQQNYRSLGLSCIQHTNTTTHGVVFFIMPFILVGSKGLWQWYVTFGITGFLDFVIARYFKENSSDWG